MLYARAVTQAPVGRHVFFPAFFFLITILAVLLAPLPAVAADAVGKVILSIGQNQAVGPDGKIRKLSRKAQVYADDMLATGSKGRLQVRFTDGSRLSLRSASEFKIAEYRFDAAEPTEGKAIYKLLKGGMRTLSGQIGKVDKEDYRLETAVATIGIRGTDFVIINEGDSVTGSVNSGEINVTGNEGSRSKNIEAGNSFVIQTEGAIQIFETPPTSETGEGSSDEGSEEESEEESEEGSDEGSEEGSEEGSDEGSEESSDETSDEASDKSSDEGSEESSQNASDESSDDNASQESDDAGQTQENANTESGSSGAGDQAAGTGSDSAETPTLSLGSETSALTETGVPASDPQETSTSTSADASQRIPQAPNPTGNGSLAPEGSVVAVAFTRKESGVYGNANDSVRIEKRSAAMIDSNVVTGVRFVHSDGISADACSPCLFSGSSDLSDVSDSGLISIGSARVSWGRWDSGFSVVANDVVVEVNGGFSFMYANSFTTASQVADVATAKSGSYLYSIGPGSALMTPPQIENGNTGTLIGYGDNAVDKEGQLYHGTYMVIDWDTQNITETSVVAQVSDGNGTRTYSLMDTGDVNLNSVLEGGQVTLTGTCYGGDCSLSETETNLSGQMTVNLIGDAAEGAVTSYGAKGTTPNGTTATISGTAVLQDAGLAP